jgi:hypothetical protein
VSFRYANLPAGVPLTHFTAATQSYIQSKIAPQPPLPPSPPPPPRKITDLPDDVLLQIATNTGIWMRSESDYLALVKVNKRFHQVFSPNLYHTFRYSFPTRILYQMPMSEQELRRMVVPPGRPPLAELPQNSHQQVGPRRAREDHRTTRTVVRRGDRLARCQEVREGVEQDQTCPRRFEKLIVQRPWAALTSSPERQTRGNR